MISFYRRLL